MKCKYGKFKLNVKTHLLLMAMSKDRRGDIGQPARTLTTEVAEDWP